MFRFFTCFPLLSFRLYRGNQGLVYHTKQIHVNAQQIKINDTGGIICLLYGNMGGNSGYILTQRETIAEKKYNGLYLRFMAVLLVYLSIII